MKLVLKYCGLTDSNRVTLIPSGEGAEIITKLLKEKNLNFQETPVLFGKQEVKAIQILSKSGIKNFEVQVVLVRNYTRIYFFNEADEKVEVILPAYIL